MMDGFTRLALVVAALTGTPAPPRTQGDVIRLTPPAGQEDARPDPWFGEDKFRHLAMSFAVTSYTFATARTLGMHDGAADLGLAAGAAAGIAKEVFDRKSGKFFSVRDLVWDAVGVAAGYAVARATR